MKIHTFPAIYYLIVSRNVFYFYISQFVLVEITFSKIWQPCTIIRGCVSPIRLLKSEIRLPYTIIRVYTFIRVTRVIALN